MVNELQDRLAKEINDLIVHLNKYEEQYWSSTFARVKKLIDNGDSRGLKALANMRGGMGSFTDLVICQINGHKIEKDQEDFANKKLMRLGESIFRTTDQLKRELNKRAKQWP